MLPIKTGLYGILALAVAMAATGCGSGTAPARAPQPPAATGQPADCPGCLLRERIGSAQPGDTVHIAPGIYTMTGGELVIDKDLKLVGAGPETTVIQAAVSLELAVHRVIRITEGSVVSISGVTIRHGKEASTEKRMVPFHSEGIGLISSGIEAIHAEFGGGVYNQGTLTLTDTIVTGNFAGGGGGVFNGAKITIEDSSITGNRSGGYGGGIFNGGVFHGTNITIEDNVAGSGGGISNWGEAWVTAAAISGNRANGTGGGILNNGVGVMTLDSSTVSRNRAVVAGGIYNFGRLRVVNSTISENSATSGAGIDSRWALTLTSTTIAANTARIGGGLVVRPITGGEGVTMSNTIIAGNTADDGPDCLGVVVSLGHNLVGNSSGCGLIAGEGDILGTAESSVDARLAGLRTGGGATATIALLPGSPAIDAGDGGACPPVDQRGVARPRGPACDIGSYER